MFTSKWAERTSGSVSIHAIGSAPGLEALMLALHCNRIGSLVINVGRDCFNLVCDDFSPLIGIA